MSSKGYFNVMEEIVTSLVNVLMISSDYQMFCKCEKCRINIIVASLNHLPSQYVTTSEEREQIFAHYNKPEQRNWLNKKIIQAIYSEGKLPGHSS